MTAKNVTKKGVKLIEQEMELQKDAMRYRFLCHGGYSGTIASYTYWECGCSKDELDKAIDKLIGEDEE